MQLDLSGSLRDVGPSGDESASRNSAVQSPFSHLGGHGRGGRGAGFHVASTARAEHGRVKEMQVGHQLNTPILSRLLLETTVVVLPSVEERQPNGVVLLPTTTKLSPTSAALLETTAKLLLTQP